MAEGEGKPTFDKGDRAAIVSGRQGVGVRGAVFWVGENKYGPGMRYGLRGDDGATYWVDESDIGREEDAPPAPAPTAPKEGGRVFDRGDTVKIIAGPGAGKVGQVGWAGKSKYGDGMRYGVRDGEDMIWVDGHQVEATEAPKEEPPGGSTNAEPSDGMASDEESALGMFADIPAEAQPPEGELPPEAFDGEDAPPEAYEDDIPF